MAAHAFQNFFGHGAHHFGRDEARRDGVDPDPVPTQFPRPSLRHADYGGLRGHIVGLAEVAVQTDHAGGVQDHPGLGRYHGRRDGAGADEDAAEVHIEDGVELLVRQDAGDGAFLEADQLGVAQDAGVVDQHVDAAESLQNGLRGGIDGGGRGDVDVLVVPGPAVGFGGRTHVPHRYLAALPGKPPGGCEADSSRAARHYDHLPRESRLDHASSLS